MSRLLNCEIFGWDALNPDGISPSGVSTDGPTKIKQ